MKNAHFKIDTRLATILAENYKSSEVALKELIDNAWDAFATEVYITIPDFYIYNDEIITIKDNGIGMSEKQVREEYLLVARDKTKSGKTKEYKRIKRRIKGRKGIGKFAGLITANLMTIKTKSILSEKVVNLEINKKVLENSAKDLEKIDLPIVINKNKDSSGTEIILSDLLDTLFAPSSEKLAQILFLEYGHQDNFKIYINNKILDTENIPGETTEIERDIPEIGKVKLKFTLANKKTKLFGISIRINGKIISEPTLFDLDNNDDIPISLIKRIYGTVEADGLLPFVSNFGVILENSIAYQNLKDFCTSEITKKINEVYKRELNIAKARRQKEINKALEKLPEHKRKFAERALNKVLEKFYNESQKKFETIVNFVLNSIEKDEYWEVLKNIDIAKNKDIHIFAEALSEFGLLEIVLISNQARNRLKYIQDLNILVDNKKTTEETIHKAIENSMWLFGIEYSLMSSNVSNNTIIQKYFKEKFKGKRKSKRPDLLLTNRFDDKYLLIEFKNPTLKVGRDALNQALKYRDDLNKWIPRENTDIIVIGGFKDKSLPSKNESERTTLMSYNGLFTKAESQLKWLIKELSN